MGDYIYNTSHSKFRIAKERQQELLAAMVANFDMIHLSAEELESLRADGPITLDDAFSAAGFAPAVNDAGDVIDLDLNTSTPSSDSWKFLRTVVGPFVEAGSFLVYAFGGDSNVWAISFEKDAEHVVVGYKREVVVVLEQDMGRMLGSLDELAKEDITDPEEQQRVQGLYKEMLAKYGTTPPGTS